jgi:hypothetical protein
MTFEFHPEAKSEFLDAIKYYETCEEGLGFDFASEIYGAIQHAVAYPSMWSEIDHEIRRCLVHRFPYGILYSIEPVGIFILAVMNLHRDPDYWKHRQ